MKTVAGGTMIRFCKIAPTRNSRRKLVRIVGIFERFGLIRTASVPRYARFLDLGLGSEIQNSDHRVFLSFLAVFWLGMFCFLDSQVSQGSIHNGAFFSWQGSGWVCLFLRSTGFTGQYPQWGVFLSVLAVF